MRNQKILITLTIILISVGGDVLKTSFSSNPKTIAAYIENNTESIGTNSVSGLNSANINGNVIIHYHYHTNSR